MEGVLPWGFRPSHPLVGANASQNCRALGVGSSLLGSLLEGVCPLPRIPAASCAKPTIEQEVAIASIALGSHAHPRDLLRRQASPILGGVVPGAQNHLGGEESVRMMVAKATAVLFAHLCPHEPLSLRCRKCTVYYTEYI